MRKSQQAFSLIELVVTLVVLAILIAFALPSFNTQIRNNRSLALGEELVSAINFTRAEAVKRGRRVSLCSSADGATCGGAWTDGLMIFVDDAATDNAALPVVGAALRTWGEFENDSRISEANAKSFVRFSSTGMLARVDDNPININADVVGCRGNVGRAITVSLAGMVSVARTDCPEDEEEE
jgi:type IV fimbrial biogenesis protein FimT